MVQIVYLCKDKRNVAEIQHNAYKMLHISMKTEHSISFTIDAIKIIAKMLFLLLPFEMFISG